MDKNRGYLLPDGDAFEDELDCALVFYPKRAEYRRALLGALTYFEKWIAWELDDDKRGKDAARSWALANFCTMECWNMACLDELLETMEAVRVLLANRKDCCDESVTYGIQDEVETDIVPSEGDPPDYYGETAVTDWDDWLEHVCYNAHLYVDNLKNLGNQMNGAVGQNSLYLGLIAAGLALLTFTGVGIPVAYLLASFVVTGLVLAVTSSTFASTADDIEDAREDIVCALILGDDLSAAVEDALSSGADWDLFYQFVDYDSATAVLYAGGHGDEYLSPEKLDDCICYETFDAPSGYHHEYPENLSSWPTHANMTNNVRSYNPDTGIAEWRFTTGGGDQFEGSFNWNLPQDFEHGGYIQILEYEGPSGARINGSAGTMTFTQASDKPKTTGGYHSGNHSGQAWVDYIAQFDDGVTYTVNDRSVTFDEYPDKSAQSSTEYFIKWRTNCLVAN